MFVCQMTGEVSSPGEKPCIVVTKIRYKHYTTEYKKVIDEVKKKFMVESDGWEIVEEKKVLPSVFNKLKEEGKVDDKGILCGSFRGRPESSKQRQNQFRKPERNFRRKRSETDNFSSKKSSYESFRAQHTNNNSRMPSLHKKPDSQTQNVFVQRNEQKIYIRRSGDVRTDRVQVAEQNQPPSQRGDFRKRRSDRG